MDTHGMNLRIEWIRIDVCLAFTYTAADANLLSRYVLKGYVLKGYALKGYVLKAYVLKAYVKKGYVLKGYVLKGYVLKGYVLKGYVLKRSPQSLEEPCDETFSGKEYMYIINVYIYIYK